MVDNEPAVRASRILYETNRQEPDRANLRGVISYTQSIWLPCDTIFPKLLSSGPSSRRSWSGIWTAAIRAAGSPASGARITPRSGW